MTANPPYVYGYQLLRKEDKYHKMPNPYNPRTTLQSKAVSRIPAPIGNIVTVKCTNVMKKIIKTMTKLHPLTIKNLLVNIPLIKSSFYIETNCLFNVLYLSVISNNIFTR